MSLQLLASVGRILSNMSHTVTLTKVQNETILSTLQTINLRLELMMDKQEALAQEVQNINVVMAANNKQIAAFVDWAESLQANLQAALISLSAQNTKIEELKVLADRGTVSSVLVDAIEGIKAAQVEQVSILNEAVALSTTPPVDTATGEAVDTATGEAVDTGATGEAVKAETPVDTTTGAGNDPVSAAE